MRYVAAYLLAVLGGNTGPAAKDIKKILTSVGIEADDACLKKVIDELKGKDIEELIAAGEYAVKRSAGHSTSIFWWGSLLTLVIPVW